MKNTRREFLKIGGLAGIGYAGAGILPGFSDKTGLHAPGISAATGPEGQVPLNRFPRMVQEYFVERLRQVEKLSDEKRASLASRDDAEAYVREVREKIQKCFGQWPDKTPLNSRVTGTIERKAYKIEKVIFESRPGFPVTANLYLPKNRKGPLPGVIGTCGHNANGKAAEPYQSFAQGLANKGYITLMFDPMGQGERLQYVTKDLKPRHGVGVMEHLYTGNQMVPTGDSLSSWFTWDGIRALDYLLSRREVDPRHIGVTGNSGGGTQATWLCGAESRFTMAAPSCFVTTFLHNMENELPADSEQYPPLALALGLDHSDFIAAMAPKPVILLGQEKDYFDARGLEKSFATLKNLYRLLGAEENIQLFIGPDYHGYSQFNREAMYGWFNRVTKISDSEKEPPVVIEKDETLYCTPHGQAGELNPKTAFYFTSRKSAELKKQRVSLAGEDLKKAVTDGLKLQSWNGIPHYRILRPVSNRLYPRKNAGTYIVETEPGIGIVVYRLDDNPSFSRPPKGMKKALLYVSHLSADDELRSDSFIRDLVNAETDSAIFACDVRGTGESMPNTCGDNFLSPYGNDYFYAGHSIMLDKPYPGQKTFDILRILNWISSFGHTEIHLAAKGWGAVPATFAAVLSDKVTRTTLKNGLTNYGDIAENEEYNWPLASLLPGVLKKFDMIDCYNSLKSKNLQLIEPWDQNSGKE